MCFHVHRDCKRFLLFVRTTSNNENNNNEDINLSFIQSLYNASSLLRCVEVKKPNNRVVSNEDIELSKPRPKTFTTTRIVNPLEPDYDLPNVAERPVV